MQVKTEATGCPKKGEFQKEFFSLDIFCQNIKFLCSLNIHLKFLYSPRRIDFYLGHPVGLETGG